MADCIETNAFHVFGHILFGVQILPLSPPFSTKLCHLVGVVVQRLDALVSGDGEEQTAEKDAAPKKEKEPQATTKMERIVGFKKEDLTSWHRLVSLLNRPSDPASLGIFRCLFGECNQLQFAQTVHLGLE